MFLDILNEGEIHLKKSTVLLPQGSVKITEQNKENLLTCVIIGMLSKHNRKLTKMHLIQQLRNCDDLPVSKGAICFFKSCPKSLNLT